MMGVIMTNAIIIFVLAFPSLEDNIILIRIDHIFIILFVLEAIVKIASLGAGPYFKDGWNRFDFIIVILSLPELTHGFFNLGTFGSVILIFRLFRLIRLLRFVKFVPNMIHILAGLRRAFKASVFVFVALFFMNFILAVLSTYMYGKVIPEYFGDPVTSAFTIFQMFTLEGWNEIPQAIADAGFEKWKLFGSRIYFLIVVLSGGILGMSLANAIFVDEMTIDNNRLLEEKIDTLQVKIDELQELLKNQNSKN